MKNITPLIVIGLMLIIGLFVFTAMPASLSEGKHKVEVDHVSATKMSDGSMTVYCMIVNQDTIPVTDVSVGIYVLDSLGNVMMSKELVFFSVDSLRPHKKALFTESFPDCWDCDGVKVVPH